MFLGALNLNYILKPLDLVAGGINGLSIVVTSVFPISPSFFILIFHLVVLVFSFFLLGKQKTISAVYASIIYPLFISISSYLPSINFCGYEDKLILSIFSGITSGVVSGYICRLNKSPGGIILITQIIDKKMFIPISKSNFIINLGIVSIGLFVFGFNNFLYTLIFLYFNKITIDKVILDNSNRQLMFNNM